MSKIWKCYKNRVIITIVAASLSSCGALKSNDAKNGYSFFVAGHVYGYPGESSKHIGVHPPFKDKLDLIKNNTNIKFGVFTGDIVEDGNNEKEWDEVDRDIAYMEKKVFFAPGNHDIQTTKKREVFNRRYGESYRYFRYAGDLFIILDPNLDKWNISGDQLDWLKRTVSRKAKRSNNIFVFFHQLLWQEREGVFKNYQLNSYSGRDDHINFRSTVTKIFEQTNKQTYMFAGDTGVYDHGFMYYRDSKNLTFIASGMGGRKQDNFLVVNIEKDKKVGFDLIALNKDSLNELGNLEDYTLPIDKEN